MTEERNKRRFDTKPTHVAAGALAAATAAFLGSRMGLAGTVTGAGIASVVSTVGTTLYQRSLDRTSRTLRAKVTAVRTAQQQSVDPTAETPTTPLDSVADQPTDRATVPLARPPLTAPPRERRWRGWRVVIGVTVAMFLLGMGVVTGVELGLGRPFSGGTEGTTVGGLLGGPTARPTGTRPATTDDKPTDATTSQPTTSVTTTVPGPIPTGTPAPTTDSTPPKTTTTTPTTTPPTTTDGVALPSLGRPVG